MSEFAAAQSSFNTLRDRVMAVASLKKRRTVLEGVGRVVAWIGFPLLLVTLAQLALHLPFYLRLPVIPALIVATLLWTWRFVVRPILDRYEPARAALLVESAQPHLQNRLVSALQLYPELLLQKPRFDASLINALVIHAQQSTQSDDFRKIVETRPARRQMMMAGATIVLWIISIVAHPTGVMGSLASFGSAWDDLGNALRKAAGAKIVVDPLSRPAFLIGTDVTLHVRQMGFQNETMQAFTRDTGASTWNESTISVNATGETDFKIAAAKKTFEARFAVGTIESDPVTVVMTERPRIASLTVEYALPDYVRRAPIVQPRSDGHLRALFGSTVVLTIEANKPLKSAAMSGDFLDQPRSFSVAGRFAKVVVRIDADRWGKSALAEIAEKYRLLLTDEFGYDNDDPAREYDLIILKDASPRISFVGLPHRSPADEPHVLQQNLSSIPIVIKASDDWGISKVAVHYRVEDLDSGAQISTGVKEQQFALPRADVPQLALLRLSDLDVQVGQRIVFWGEAEDAYNLDPSTGPHRAATSQYRIAVVTQEEMFTEAVYRDDWSTQWYESLQVATLAKREIPARTSPESEPAAQAAKKLMEASQAGDSVRGADQQLVQDYFESLNVVRTTTP